MLPGVEGPSGANHWVTDALTLGRPKPFAPDPSSVEAYGEEATTFA